MFKEGIGQEPDLAANQKKEFSLLTSLRSRRKKGEGVERGLKEFEESTQAIT